MRVLTLCLAIGIMLTAACGGSSSNGGTGGTAGGGLGAGGSGAGGAGGGSVTLTGTCANLTCLSTLSSLVANCQPSGTCTQQVSTTGSVACYTNGVKLQTGIDTSTFATTMTLKNGGSVCYSMAITGLLTPPTTIVFKNASGTTLGTMAVDTNTTTNTMTVTCPGGTATVIDASCGSGPSDLATASESAMTGQCTQGACTF